MRTRLFTAALAFALPLSAVVAGPATAAPASSVVIKGHVKSPTGKAIGGVQVSIYSSTRLHGRVVKRVTTSRTGRYELKVPSSVWYYQLKVTDFGDRDADHGDGEWASTLVKIPAADGSVIKRDQVLHHGARVTGRVLDRGGKPAGAGVKVSVGLLDGSAPGAETLTRKDGTFRITNAPAGAATVGFTSPRPEEGARLYSASTITGTRDFAKATVLDLASGRATSGISFRFPYLGRITGTVRVDGDLPSEEGSSAFAELTDAKGDVLFDGLANPEFGVYDLTSGTYFLRFHSGSDDYPVVAEYWKDSATRDGATPLVIGPKGGAITGIEADLASK